MPKRKKPKEPVQIIFPEKYTVVGADLSLKRPSFCILTIENMNGTANITDIKFSTVDNKKDNKKCHGQLLDEIKSAFISCCPLFENVFLVRENEIMKVKVPSERSLSKVVGLMDWVAWKWHETQWYSIYPMTIKKLITGNGRAEKQDVANCLEKYIGKIEYKCDDESDAAAVAIAWLIQEGQIKEK